MKLRQKYRQGTVGKKEKKSKRTSCFYERTNKIEKPLANVILNKERKKSQLILGKKESITSIEDVYCYV